MTNDYYGILGVDRAATLAQIKVAYRRLAKELHPDVNPGRVEAEERFKTVNDAYTVLSNTKLKKLYDSGVDPLAKGLTRSQRQGRSAGDADDNVWPPPTDPMAVARCLIDRIFQDRRLWWRGSFYRYTGTCWVEIADATIRSRIYKALEHAAFTEVVMGIPVDEAWEPTRYKIANVMDALTAVVHIPEHFDPPAWLTGEDHGRVVSMHNGLLQVENRTLLPHTTRLFNLMALPYDYDQDAPQPERWRRFLKELWPDDPDSIALLQEYFGYVVSGETDLHKIMLLVGPPRSGKGTIARVLTALIGAANVAGPTLASLGQNFGLSPLLGKSLAVVSDARLGDKGHTVVERLLAISGEDAITVDRKYREPWTGRLGVRFLVISNELPSLGDASGAVATRFVVLTLGQSWLGRENKRLTAELLTELPAILDWALDGLDRLHDREHFTEPSTSRDAVTLMNDLASPVGAFIRDRCTRGPEHEIPVSDLFGAWKHWCDENGHKAGNTQRFGRDLRAAVPSVKTARPRVVRDGPRSTPWWAKPGGDEIDDAIPVRERHYLGIALKPTLHRDADHRGPEGGGT